jgi:hypothetical protein
MLINDAADKGILTKTVLLTIGMPLGSTSSWSTRSN